MIPIIADEVYEYAVSTMYWGLLHVTTPTEQTRAKRTGMLMP